MIFNYSWFGSGGYFQENSEEEAIFKIYWIYFIDEDKKIKSLSAQLV